MSDPTPQGAAPPATLDPNEYMVQRVDDQIGWYGGKSQWNQRWFKRFRVVEIVAAALIPFLTAIPAFPAFLGLEKLEIKYVIGGLGVLITVVAGILALYQFQERWTEYRATSEALKKEKFLFLTKADPYNVGDGYSMFVQKVETLISKENTNWTQSFVQPGQGNDRPA